jgi:hypothetical protein
LWGAGLLAVILGFSACGGTASRVAATGSATHQGAPVPTTVAVAKSAAVSAAPVTSPASTDIVAAGVSTMAAGSTAAATAAVDPAALLQTALDALTGTYHFVSTVSVDGATVLVAEGDRVGDGSRLTLTRTSAAVPYIITPGGSWVMEDGSTWQKLDADPASTDPINSLRSPTTVQLVSSDPTTVSLAVTVPPAALGIPGEAAVAVTVTLNGGVLAAVSYSATVNNKPASVTSTFGPAVDATPVVAPG